MYGEFLKFGPTNLSDDPKWGLFERYIGFPPLHDISIAIFMKGSNERDCGEKIVAILKRAVADIEEELATSTYRFEYEAKRAAAGGEAACRERSAKSILAPPSPSPGGTGAAKAAVDGARVDGV